MLEMRRWSRFHEKETERLTATHESQPESSTAPGKSPVCHQGALLSSPSLQPEAHEAKACLQVPSSEDHETRPGLAKSVCVAPGAAGEKLGSQSTTRDFLSLLLFILNVVQPTQSDGKGQPRNVSKFIILCLTAQIVMSESLWRVPAFSPVLSLQPHVSFIKCPQWFYR